MIIELPNYLDVDVVNNIKEQIRPYVPSKKQFSYNRDGKTLVISETKELQSLDAQLNKIFADIQTNIIADRYKPRFGSGDTGYEYHLYEPNDICHVHSDGEVMFDRNGPSAVLLRYASVILHLNTVNEGGELVFPVQNQKVKTEIGKVVIFPPYGMYPHYTTPSLESREVIVSWFVYNNLYVHRT